MFPDQIVLMIQNSKEIFEIISETFVGIRDVKMFAKEKFFSNNFNKQNNIYETNLLLRDLIGKLPRIFFEFISILIISSIIISFIALDKNLNLLVPFMSLVAVSIIRMIPSFSAITESLTHIKVYKIAYDTVVDEIFLFLNLPIFFGCLIT